jgi:hypothetical protein
MKMALLRLDQVLLLGEEVIGTPQHLGPEALGGEVDEVGEGGGLFVFRHAENVVVEYIS